MPSRSPAEPKRKSFTVEEADKMLPLVSAIVGDIVRQYQAVESLRERLSAVLGDRRKRTNDIYTEELAQFQSEMQAEESKLAAYIDELTKLGVELKGPDGLCDFPSTRDGRSIYLCWRHGEPKVQHWHELDAGFSGRQPLAASPVKSGGRSF